MSELALASEAETAQLGEDLALAVAKGDLVFLSGDLGAGKSTLARAFIRSIADDERLDVPSPTFTLVQSYPELRLPVSHVDLYRISSPEEIDELGLEEALDDGIVIVEWPEQGAGELPAPSLSVTLHHEGNGRVARLSGAGELLARLERSLQIRAFLDRSGYRGARRRFLLGDASVRTYETVDAGRGEPLILMNAPEQRNGPLTRDGRSYRRIAHLSDRVSAFVAVDRLLRERGFRAPEIHAQDLDAGILLIEHLGDGLVTDEAGKPVPDRYAEAARLLARMHEVHWPDRVEVAPGVMHTIHGFDREAMLVEADLLCEWYVPWVTGKPMEPALQASYAAAWGSVFDSLQSAETSILLRDYHSPNLIWRQDAQGNDRLGLIDFQDAMIGPAAYDVASLALDARVTISRELEAALVGAYCAARSQPFDRDAFLQAYAIMAAQRTSKILGIFVRLDQRDGKPQYLKHLPRIRDYLARALEHPALEPLDRWFREAGVSIGKDS
ncbi:MAG: tRNA (adenosine(37)-N6)-threonylcarbamoyltransferase complex ATPase subunit type 1 TsaE [Phyllobacterium sp.]